MGVLLLTICRAIGLFSLVCESKVNLRRLPRTYFWGILTFSGVSGNSPSPRLLEFRVWGDLGFLGLGIEKNSFRNARRDSLGLLGLPKLLGDLSHRAPLLVVGNDNLYLLQGKVVLRYQESGRFSTISCSRLAGPKCCEVSWGVSCSGHRMPCTS